MMDEFFFQQNFPSEIFWGDASFPVVNQSAFVQYREVPSDAFGALDSSCRNINKRMIEFLRQNSPSRVPENDKERGFRRMISERMRREKQKQGFVALHSLLPSGTKNDKNSIMKVAAERIEELEKCKTELQRRNDELEENLKRWGRERDKGPKIRVKLGNPTSRVDSMVEVLKCLKNMGTKTRSLHSDFDAQEFIAVFDKQPEIGVAEVEKAIEKRLHDVERKHLTEYQYPDGWPSCK